jgi:hypothetical protein
MPPPITTTQLTDWYISRSKHLRVAAWLAAWAAKRPAGAIVPAPEKIAANLDTITRQATIRRALSVLARCGLLVQDSDTGHYHVSATQPARPGQQTGRPTVDGLFES